MYIIAKTNYNKYVHIQKSRFPLLVRIVKICVSRNEKNFFLKLNYSLELKDLCLMKLSREMLQNLPYYI